MITTRIMKYTIGIMMPVLLAAVALVAVPTAGAQMKSDMGTAPSANQTTGMVDSLKGIKIGMTANEVKDVLGKPKVTDATGMLFEMSNDESMQLKIKKGKTVTMIAVIYNGKDAEAPAATEIFGNDVIITPQENGNIYKRVRNSAAKYWIAYSRINLKDYAMTTITMQKIN
ncbi:MAG: hypothetical protein WBO10_10370 [Pyrinomonadaceae bacterium]